jgi:hypothetical protein
MSVIATAVMALLLKAGRRLRGQISRFPWEVAGERILRLL